MRVEQLRDPLVLLELQQADLPVRARAGKNTARLMRRPSYQIDASIVLAKVKDFAPWRAIPPYYDPSVV